MDFLRAGAVHRSTDIHVGALDAGEQHQTVATVTVSMHVYPMLPPVLATEAAASITITGTANIPTPIMRPAFTQYSQKHSVVDSPVEGVNTELDESAPLSADEATNFDTDEEKPSAIVPIVGTKESVCGLHQKPWGAQDAPSRGEFDESVSLLLDGSNGTDIGAGGQSMVLPMGWTSKSTRALCDKLWVVQGRWWWWWWASRDTALEDMVNMCRDYGLEQTDWRVPHAHLLWSFERDGSSIDQISDDPSVAWILMLEVVKTMCYLYCGVRSVLFIAHMLFGRGLPAHLCRSLPKPDICDAATESVSADPPGSLAEPEVLPTAASSNASKQNASPSAAATTPGTAADSAADSAEDASRCTPSTASTAAPASTEDAAPSSPATTPGAAAEVAEDASRSTASSAFTTAPANTQDAASSPPATTSGISRDKTKGQMAKEKETALTILEPYLKLGKAVTLFKSMLRGVLTRKKVLGSSILGGCLRVRNR